MTIYTRPDELVFAENANPGEVVPFPDILRGWGLSFEQTEGKPPMEWMNAVMKRQDEAIRYLLQRGIPEWSDTDDYPVEAYVQHEGATYRSLLASNGVEPGTSNITWALWGLKTASAAQALEGLSDSLLMTPATTAGLFPFRGIQTYSTAGIHNWVVPEGVTKVWVTVIGGGGGGGGVASGAVAASSGGGGGGGGGGGARRLVDLTALEEVSVTVGAPGAGGKSSNGWDGLNGGASSFGEFCSATGGLGGIGSGSGLTTPSAFSGAGGGIGSGGDLNVRGCGGGDGTVMQYSATSLCVGGNGGGAAFFGGGVDGGSVGQPQNGSSPGEGGPAAAAAGGTVFSGGDGAPGIVIIQW